MTIEIRQSDLERIGFQGDFAALRRPEKAQVAAMALHATGRSRQAFLLEINNPGAIAGIVYVPDGPALPRRGFN